VFPRDFWVGAKRTADPSAPLGMTREIGLTPTVIGEIKSSSITGSPGSTGSTGSTGAAATIVVRTVAALAVGAAPTVRVVTRLKASEWDRETQVSEGTSFFAWDFER
jgi:hypothetical protein